MMVLDASALIAFLFDEPGAEKVRPEVRKGLLSTVNLAEVLGRIARDGKQIDNLSAALAVTLGEIVALTADQARLAAQLLPLTRSHGLSLGDRCCLGLAIERGLPVLTADRTWSTLSLPWAISVRFVR